MTTINNRMRFLLRYDTVSYLISQMGISMKAANSGGTAGRPRNPAVDQAILRAALELFIEHGVAGASIERIARRARVAKTSIYRRWSSPEALLAQAIEVARNATGYTADLVDRTPPQDLVKLLVEVCEVADRPEIRKLMTRLIGSIPDYPKLIEVYRATYYLPRRQAFGRALERVRAAGLLAKDIDLEALADTIIGAVMYRLIMPSPGDNPAGELRDHMISLLRQAGFDVSVVA
jgi:AcrR family transcriptional regulator